MELLFDILNYFIDESVHTGFANMPVPDEFPVPIFMADDPNENNTDKEVNPTIEKHL